MFFTIFFYTECCAKPFLRYWSSHSEFGGGQKLSVVGRASGSSVGPLLLSVSRHRACILKEGGRIAPPRMDR